MVTNVPTPSLFGSYGLDYLNLSWTNVVSVILDFEDAEPWTGQKGEEEREDYYGAARHELTTAISLAEQGAEFLLKARIAKVSPWLLLTQAPQDWPRRCQSEDIPFAKFRTVDAQDLVKIHDTFCETRLPVEFPPFFDDLRKQRNSIIHTVDESLTLSISKVVGYILEICHMLLPEREWHKYRRSYLENGRHSLMYPLFPNAQLVREITHVMELLTPSELKKYFAFNKRQRNYICPNCYAEDEARTVEPRTALLRPNTPNSETLYCFLCESELEVEREDCTESGCNGNVIYDGGCLTCNRTQA